MEKEQVTSWILLSIAYASQTAPANLASISQIADGINHAVPTQKELQESIHYLMANHLVAKEGKKYTLTKIGKDLVEKTKSTTTMGTWKELEAEIKRLS